MLNHERNDMHIINLPTIGPKTVAAKRNIQPVVG